MLSSWESSIEEIPISGTFNYTHFLETCPLLLYVRAKLRLHPPCI